MEFTDSFISQFTGDYNQRKYEFFYDDNYMKTSYAAAEQTCKHSGKEVANFKALFGTSGAKWDSNRTVRNFEDFDEDHDFRRIYEESMRNLW